MPLAFTPPMQKEFPISFEVMRRFFAILSVLGGLVLVGAVIVFVGSRFSSGLASVRRDIEETLDGRELTFAFVVALTATLGSLYMSEIVHLIPCELCWFQRIAMYPLTLILGIAAWKNDRGIVRYALPLASLGGLVSIYHRTIQQFPSLSAGECNPVAPCTAPYFREFGFITIPTMALVAFGLIILLLVVAMSNDRTEAAATA